MTGQDEQERHDRWKVLRRRPGVTSEARKFRMLVIRRAAYRLGPKRRGFCGGTERRPHRNAAENALAARLQHRAIGKASG
jgi:hypothetical protein